jgi:hypothetical protein
MTDPKVLLERQMSDWRVHEGSDDELNDAQKKPWAVKVMEGSYGGLNIDFIAEDGTVHTVAFEIDEGNLRVLVYGGETEDLNAILTTQKDGVHVSSNTGPKAYLFNTEGSRVVSAEPAPSFVSDGKLQVGK